jgi:hypothetical protein
MNIYNFSNIIEVGCGKRPTLATFMAYNYNTTVFAIDPKVDTELCQYTTLLFLYKMKLSEFIEFKKSFEHGATLVLCNHSHVSKKEIEDLTDKMSNWVYLTMPCCVNNVLDRPYVKFKDEHIWSPENSMFLQDKHDNLATLLNLQFT